MTTADDLGAWIDQRAGDAVFAAVQPLNEQVAGLRAELAAANAQVGQLEAAARVDAGTIAALQARIAALTDPGYLPGWGLPVWRDEFDGNTLDRTKWGVYTGGLSYDQALYRDDPRNIILNNSILTLRALKDGNATDPYTSAYLTTAGKATWSQTVRFEIRAKLPTTAGDSRGIWPAIWCRNAGSGEWDLMEAWGEPTSRTDYRAGSGSWTLFANTNNPADGKKSGWLTPAGSPRLSGDWHVYGGEWSPAGFTGLLDGKVVYTVPTPDAAAPWLVNSFTTPLHLRLQLQVGSSYWGNPDPAHPEWTKVPADFQVDWVRVYQKG